MLLRGHDGGHYHRYSLLRCVFLLRGHDAGHYHSYSLPHCPTEVQQVLKCNGVRNLKQLLKGRDKKTAISDVKMIISECEQRAVSAVHAVVW